jgi:hypothetical protein
MSISPLRGWVTTPERERGGATTYRQQPPAVPAPASAAAAARRSSRRTPISVAASTSTSAAAVRHNRPRPLLSGAAVRRTRSAGTPQQGQWPRGAAAVPPARRTRSDSAPPMAVPPMAARDADVWHTTLTRINSRMERVGLGFGQWLHEQAQRAQAVEERLTALEARQAVVGGGEGRGCGGALEQRLGAMEAQIAALWGAAARGGGEELLSVEVVCPEGCSEGEGITVDVSGGQLEIEVPAGVGPGDTFRVEVPEVAVVQPRRDAAPPPAHAAGRGVEEVAAAWMERLVSALGQCAQNGDGAGRGDADAAANDEALVTRLEIAEQAAREASAACDALRDTVQRCVGGGISACSDGGAAVGGAHQQQPSRVSTSSSVGSNGVQRGLATATTPPPEPAPSPSVDRMEAQQEEEADEEQVAQTAAAAAAAAEEEEEEEVEEAGGHDGPSVGTLAAVAAQVGVLQASYLEARAAASRADTQLVALSGRL